MRISPLLLDPTARAIIHAAEEDAKQRLARLTPMERKVVEQILEGKFNKNIAHHFGRSHRTIENHRLRIMEKAETDSVIDLLRLIVLAD